MRTRVHCFTYFRNFKHCACEGELRSVGSRVSHGNRRLTSTDDRDYTPSARLQRGTSSPSRRQIRSSITSASRGRNRRKCFRPSCDLRGFFRRGTSNGCYKGRRGSNEVFRPRPSRNFVLNMRLGRCKRGDSTSRDRRSPISRERGGSINYNDIYRFFITYTGIVKGSNISSSSRTGNGNISRILSQVSGKRNNRNLLTSLYRRRTIRGIM